MTDFSLNHFMLIIFFITTTIPCHTKFLNYIQFFDKKKKFFRYIILNNPKINY